MKRISLMLVAVILSAGFAVPCDIAEAAPNLPKQQAVQVVNEFSERKSLFEQISLLTGIPWQYLAAVDQYERALTKANPRKRPKRDGQIGVFFTELQWVGMLNPDHEDTDPLSIGFFNGLGRDGTGDGKADRNNDLDVLYTMAAIMSKNGVTMDEIRISLWEHYQNARSVQRIEQFADIYDTFNSLELHEHSFPLPPRTMYSYNSTWGAGRSWGGYRIHEGTDIFAGYGVPVRSTCYGVIEVIGWNRYGGWRVGIRDLNNVYHYYAHLSGYNKPLSEGDIVKPGQVIGWVGSSGYGKPGTQGKFPPHLHYGLYRDTGYSEWSFDPFPLLRKWEREERLRLRKR